MTSVKDKSRRHDFADVDLDKFEREIKKMYRYLCNEDVQVQQVRLQDAFNDHCATRFNYLYLKSPNLFEILLIEREKFSFEELELFIDTLKKCISGELPKSEADDILAEWGNRKFIDPLVDSEEMREWRESEDGKKWMENRKAQNNISIEELTSEISDIKEDIAQKESNFNQDLTDAAAESSSSSSSGPDAPKRIRVKPSKLSERGAQLMELQRERIEEQKRLKELESKASENDKSPTLSEEELLNLFT